MSIDGRIGARPGEATRITGEKSLQQVHVLRDRVDAILVGRGTVLTDDPSLTTRLAGRLPGRDPLRVVLDTDLRLSPAARILTQQSAAQTWIFCRRGADRKRRDRLEAAGAIIKSVESVAKGMLDLHGVLTVLGQSQITSVLVEGGSTVHGSFLRGGLADQLLLFVAPKFLGEQGIPLATFDVKKKSSDSLPQFKIVKTRRYGDDILIEGRFFEKKEV